MSTDRITRMSATPGMAAPPRSPVEAPAMPTYEVERSALELSTGGRTLGEMILRASDRDAVALRYKEGGSWKEMGYRELVRAARDIARGLIALGIEPGERVSILSDTRPEWTIA